MPPPGRVSIWIVPTRHDWHTDASRLQQTPLQQRAHVPPPVGDHQHVDIAPDHPIDDAPGLEEDLPVLAHADLKQLPRPGAPFRMLGQSLECAFDPFQYVVRASRGIVALDLVANLLQVARGIVGQPDQEWHQPACRRSLSRATTSAAGRTRPASTCRSPSASILSSARVSSIRS